MRELYETDRLILKVLDETYSPQVLDYYMRNRDFLEEWELKRSNEFYTLEAQTAQLRNDLKEFEEKRALRLWIFKKGDEESSKAIGTIAFNNIVWGAFLSCFLGYKLDKDEINKGYVTEALKKGIEIAFGEYKLHRIEANIMPKNARSLRVVEKLGFYNEGLAHKYLRLNGKWENHIHMVLLNEELE
ncbi:MAG: GNAT family N-acetyltransferase [Clostridia bacterium]